MNSTAWREIPVFQIGNRRDISAWQTDPRPALLQRNKVGLVMVPPVGLDKFLSPGDFKDNGIQFIHGAKGSGKTSLLLAKRVQLDEAVANRELLCVPTGFPYVFSPFMDDTTIRFDSWESLAFSGAEAWKYAWLVLLGALVLNAVDRDQEKITLDSTRKPLLSETLVKALTGLREVPSARLEEKQWVVYFKHLIENTRRNPRETLKRLYESEVLPHLNASISTRSSPILVFVDGIDETFVGPNGSPLLKLVKAKMIKRLLGNEIEGTTLPDGDPNELARQIWVTAQTSLLAVASEFLLQTDSVVRLIGSMRSEAYGEASRSGTQARGQRVNFIREISYTRDHLEAIMRANIRADLHSQNLDKPEKGDEFEKYFGKSTIRHPQTAVDEPIFNYLCRHTFEEPRDLMVIGLALKDLNGLRSNATRVHTEVAKVSVDILRDYFRFMDEDWDKKFEEVVFEHIERNILTLEDAQKVAERVKQANKIRNHHPLCYLYKRGLLGTVSPGLKQIFLRIAQVAEAERRQLPRSTAYLLHPVLDQLISQTRSAANKERYLIVQGIAVGNGLPWVPGKRVKRVRLGLKGSTVSLVVDGVSLSNGSGAGGPGFHRINDIPTAIFVVCLKEMVDLQTNAPSIENIMFAISDMVKRKELQYKTRRKGTDCLTSDYIRESLLGPDRTPPQLDTIVKRLKEHNILQISITRSLKSEAIIMTGIDWDDIEIEERDD